MDSAQALNQEILDIVHTLQNEGMVDQQLETIHSLKNTTSPFFFAQLISIFCTDVQTVLRQITTALDQPVLDFDEMDEYCIKLKGSTSCVGARRITLACVDLRKAIDSKSKEGCLLALNGLRHQFLNLRPRFDTILQVEKRIAASSKDALE